MAATAQCHGACGGPLRGWVLVEPARAGGPGGFLVGYLSGTIPPGIHPGVHHGAARCILVRPGHRGDLAPCTAPPS